MVGINGKRGCFEARQIQDKYELTSQSKCFNESINSDNVMIPRFSVMEEKSQAINPKATTTQYISPIIDKTENNKGN